MNFEPLGQMLDQLVFETGESIPMQVRMPLAAAKDEYINDPSEENKKKLNQHIGVLIDFLKPEQQTALMQVHKPWNVGGAQASKNNRAVHGQVGFDTLNQFIEYILNEVPDHVVPMTVKLPLAAAKDEYINDPSIERKTQLSKELHRLLQVLPKEARQKFVVLMAKWEASSQPTKQEASLTTAQSNRRTQDTEYKTPQGRKVIVRTIKDLDNPTQWETQIIYGEGIIATDRFEPGNMSEEVEFIDDHLEYIDGLYTEGSVVNKLHAVGKSLFDQNKYAQAFDLQDILKKLMPHLPKDEPIQIVMIDDGTALEDAMPQAFKAQEDRQKIEEYLGTCADKHQLAKAISKLVALADRLEDKGLVAQADDIDQILNQFKEREYNRVSDPVGWDESEQLGKKVQMSDVDKRHLANQFIKYLASQFSSDLKSKGQSSLYQLLEQDENAPVLMFLESSRLPIDDFDGGIEVLQGVWDTMSSDPDILDSLARDVRGSTDSIVTRLAEKGLDKQAQELREILDRENWGSRVSDPIEWNEAQQLGKEQEARVRSQFRQWLFSGLQDRLAELNMTLGELLQSNPEAPIGLFLQDHPDVDRTNENLFREVKREWKSFSASYDKMNKLYDKLASDVKRIKTARNVEERTCQDCGTQYLVDADKPRPCPECARTQKSDPWGTGKSPSVAPMMDKYKDRMRKAPGPRTAGSDEHGGKPDKVVEIADAIRRDQDVSDDVAYRMAWETYCSYVNPSYDGCTGKGKSKRKSPKSER